jgi:CubicO group peptidase (beta-lactamase class C family)
MFLKKSEPQTTKVMNKRSVSMLLLSLLFTGLPIFDNTVSAQSQVVEPNNTRVGDVFDRNRLKRLDDLLKKAVKEGDLPSAVCYVSFAGEPIYFKAFGEAEREEKSKNLTKDAVFRIASQTKLVTTVALMRLFEDGYFDLDDPIKKFLPEFSNPVVYVSGSAETHNLVTRPATGDITIRQLLTHSSGISYDTYGQDLEVIRYGYPITTAEAVYRIAKLPLKHDPGAGFTYGFSLDVAGRLAEVLTGVRLDSVIKHYVLDPLDMKSTAFILNKNQIKRLVPVYTKPLPDGSVSMADSLDNYYPLNASLTYFGGGAGLCSTAEDYGHLCNMILNYGQFKGKHVLQRKTVEIMITDQLFGAAGDYKFGLGLEITTPKTFARTMKTVGSLSWGGYYGTEYFIDMKYKTVVQLYTNKLNWNSKKDVWENILKAVYTSILQ